MPAFRFTLLLALLVGQATAFFVADKPVKALGPLQSYNRNYDSAGHEGGMRRYNDYDRGNYGPSNNRRNEYGGGYGGDYGGGGGAYGSYDRGYGGDYGGGYGSRSKFSDWLNGSSNYIPTSSDRNYVMDRGYETGGRYNNNNMNYNNNNMNYNGDRYSNNVDRYSNNVDRYSNNGDRFSNGGDRYSNNGYNNREMYSPNRYNSDRSSPRGYGSREYSGGRNSPINYSSNRVNDRDYGRSVNGGYNRNYRDNRSLNSEYARTHRSANDSHRQDYPNYGMGGMEDQFGYKKWWDGN